ALIAKKKSFSYKELFENIWASKEILEIEHNISKGDIVILAANKNVAFVFTYFALHLIGAKVMPIDEKINQDRFKFILDKTSPKLIIGLENKINSIKIIEFDRFVDLKLSSVPSNISFPKLDDNADILFTTGTTGEPKGVILSHRNITQSAHNINSFIGNNHKDTELLAMPISHSFGLARLRCVLSVGGTLVLLGSIVNMKRMFRMFDEYKVTGLGLVPASWSYIKKMSGNKLAEYSNQLNYIEFGSAYMSAEDKMALTKLFSNTRLCMHYGLTEASRSTFMEFNTSIDYLNTVGKPSPNVIINIFDENGNELYKEEEGEICIKGDHVSREYLNVEKNNLFYGEYFRTGDIGLINNKNYIVLKGRSKELINVGGKKVSPLEIENKIKELDSELESVCIGINDPQGVLGEVVKAFVVKGSSICDFEQIDDFLKKNLEKHKVPVKYEWINEVPRTSSGKIQRQKLK
ncbi:acyl--CoA ligase, partial [Polaribacter sp.]|nr:acyl--CoA ligase [Polaribacter sp.]